MRRLLSIALLLLFSLPLISPLLALTSNGDTILPACCRRNGAHHCAMKLPPAGGINLSSIQQHCPAFPAVVTPVRHGDLSFPVASLISAGLVCHSTLSLQTQPRARTTFDRARQQRGPPTELL